MSSILPILSPSRSTSVRPRQVSDVLHGCHSRTSVDCVRRAVPDAAERHPRCSIERHSWRRCAEAESRRASAIGSMHGLARRHRRRRIRRLLRRAHARALLPPQSTRVTLVSDVNFMLYTPLLPGAAAGTLEPRHVVVPLREAARPHGPAHRRGRRRRPGPQRVRVQSLEGHVEELAYDQLVVAIGSVSRTLPIPGLAEHGLGFKSLPDAIELRNRLLRTLETAETLDDPAERQAWLTLRVRRRRLRRARGPRRAAGLRRRRDRALPALPHAGDALDPRRGDRPRDARDLARPRRVRRARAARPRDRDPHRDDARGADGDDGAPERRRGRPDAHVRVDRGRAAASGGRASWACRWTTAAGSRRRDDARRGPAERVGDRRRRRGARPGEEGRRAAPPTAQHAMRQGRRVARNVAATLGTAASGRSRYKTKGVFVDMGQGEAVAEHDRASSGAAGPRGCSPARTTWR